MDKDLIDMGVRTRLGLKKPRRLPPPPAFVQRFGMQRSYAQMFQDFWVLAEMNEKRGGFFVEIGAFDGINLSNSYLLEHVYGWTGILAEPNPEFTSVINDCRTASLCPMPVSAQSGESVTMLFIPGEPELSSLESKAFTDGLAERRKGGKHVKQTTISLNDMLKMYDAPSDIDYMSIDTEGNELDILSTFDFDRYRVRLFSIEHNYTSANDELDRLFAQKGYTRKYRDWSQWDAWYVRD